MASPDWKYLLKLLIETGYEKTLKDMPNSFKKLSKEQKRGCAQQMKIVRRSAIFDIGYSVVILVGNGFAAAYVPFAGAIGLNVSAAASIILVRRASHALINVLSRRI